MGLKRVKGTLAKEGKEVQRGFQA